MAALTQARQGTSKTIKFLQYPVAADVQCFQGGMACIDTTTGDVTPGAVSTTLLPVGKFAETVDNTGGAAGAVLVTVEFPREINAEWWDNDTGTAVTAADVGQDCYILDDHTVSFSDGTGTRSKAGRVLQVDSVKGVLVDSTVIVF